MKTLSLKEYLSSKDVKRVKLLLHPFYILSLLVLITNDWLLKDLFHNVWTGKLSDFTGLFIFPIFFSVLMPKHTKLIHILTALGFVFWKTELSQPLLHFIYSQGWQVERVVDYSDLIALVSIIFSYFFIEYETASNRLLIVPRMSLTYTVLLISFMAFCATSPIHLVPMSGDYNLKKDVSSKLTKQEIIETLKNEGYNIQRGMAVRTMETFNGRYTVRTDTFIVDTSDVAQNIWHLTDIQTKDGVLQALNIQIAENYNETGTRISLVGMCVDGKINFLRRKEINKYDRYLKRKILRKLKR